MVLEDSAALARVNLDSTGVEVIDLESPALSVVVVKATAPLRGSRVCSAGRRDRHDFEQRTCCPAGRFGEVLVYDRSGDRLITAGQYGGVYVYTFARDTNTFGMAENPFDVSVGSVVTRP